MKKIICVILALLMSVAVLFTGCQDNTTPGGIVDVSGEQDDQVILIESDIEIEEGETTVETNLGKGVETFLSGKYYLEGMVYSEGEAMPVLLATDGKNIQFTASYTGLAFCVMVLDDVTYMVLPTTKQYTEFSQTLIDALGIADSIGANEFQSIQSDDLSENANISQYSVTINGDAGICTIYTYDDTVVKLYSIGDRLIQVENYDLDGTMTMQIVVDELTDQIPADQLTLKGYEKASPTSFIKALMSSLS